MKDILGDKLHETMSLDGLDSKVSMTETVFNDFAELRTRYGI